MTSSAKPQKNEDVKLSDITTIGVGGKPEAYLTTHALPILAALAKTWPPEAPEYILVGGGSNILPNDGDFDKVVVHILPTGSIDSKEPITFFGHLWAGERLDDVARVFGLAPLSGIPGSLGGAVVQNAGAYGSEIADYIEKVLVCDRTNDDAKEFIELTPAQCQFKYRSSIFKVAPQDMKYIVLGVRLKPQPINIEVKHPQLASALGVEIGQRAMVETVRDKVLQLRRSKGMLDRISLDSFVPDPEEFMALASRSATSTETSTKPTSPTDEFIPNCGSFFKNPVVPVALADQLPGDAPRYEVEQPQTKPLIKLSAAWLIENAGLNKGFKLSAQACAKLSDKHVLSLQNDSSGTTGTPGADLRELAAYVTQQVQAKWGITLEPEAVIL